MAQNALASGSIVLTANADQMTKGLADAEKKAEQSFHKTEQKLNKASQKFLKHEGGFLGMVGGGLVSDLGIAAPIAGLIGVGLAAKQIGGVIGEWGGFTKAMEKSEKLTSEMAKAMDRVRAESDAWLATAAGTDDKIKALTEDLARSDTESASLAANMHAAKKHLDDIADVDMKKWSSWNPLSLVIPDHDFTMAKSALKELEDEYAKTKERTGKLRKDLGELVDPTMNKKLIGDINATTKALEFEAKTAGMAGSELKRMQFLEMARPRRSWRSSTRRRVLPGSGNWTPISTSS